MNSFLGFNTGLTNCNGAEFYLNADGSYSLRLVKLSLSKKLIYIDEKIACSGTLSEVLTSDLAGPLAINITGKGVLIKKTERQELITEQSLQHLFPQVRLDEFYIQHFPSGTKSFIAIVRKDIVDKVIVALQKKDISVMMLSLGPFVVDQVLPQLNSYGSELQFDGHVLKFDTDKNWQDYFFMQGAKVGFPLKIDIEAIPENYLVAYAVAFQLMLGDQLDLIEVEAVEIKQNLAELYAQLKYKKYGTFMLCFFFVLLMLNFLMLSHYNSSNQGLMGKAGHQSDVFENRQKIEQEVKMKEHLVQGLGWNKGYAYAYISDQIGQTVPKEIKLEELQINSLYGSNAGSLKDAPLENSTIRIKGQSLNVYAVNNWIYTLKDKRWVKGVKLEKYVTDDQKQVQIFTLLLNY